MWVAGSWIMGGLAALQKYCWCLRKIAVGSEARTSIILVLLESVSKHPTYSIMALQELPSALRQLTLKQTRPATRCLMPHARRYASGEAVAADAAEAPLAPDLQDLESESSFTAKYSAEAAKDYDPIKRSKARKSELPASRYVRPSFDVGRKY
jgi:hypothetical protein